MSNLPESYSLIEKLEQFFYIFVNFFFRFLTFLTFLLCQIVQIVRYSFSARLVVTFRGVKLAKGTIFGWDNWENLDEPWRTETDCFWRTETDWFWRTETDWFWLRHEKLLPDRESNPGLPLDRRGCSPLYYRWLGIWLILTNWDRLILTNWDRYRIGKSCWELLFCTKVSYY